MPDLQRECGHPIVEQRASLPWLQAATHSLRGPVNYTADCMSIDESCVHLLGFCNLCCGATVKESLPS